MHRYLTPFSFQNRIITICTVVTILCLSLLTACSKEKNHSPETTSISITSGSFQKDFRKLYELLHKDSLLHSNVLLRTGSKTQSNVFRSPQMPTTHAWAMLGLASLSSISQSQNDKILFLSEFRNWQDLANTWDENTALFPILRSADLFSDDSSLSRKLQGWYWGRMKFLLLRYEEHRKAGTLRLSEPMLLASYARQLSDSLALLNDDSFVVFLFQQSQLSNLAHLEATRSKLRKTIDELHLILAQRIKEDAVRTPSLSDTTLIPQYICWAGWAYYGKYLATNDPEDMSAALRIINLTSFDKRDPDTVRLSTLQSILPCTEVMLDIGGIYKTRGKKILEQYVLINWDSEQTRVCTGDGGYLTVSPKNIENRNCFGNAKFLSDAAWITHQLLQFRADEEFRIMQRKDV